MDDHGQVLDRIAAALESLAGTQALALKLRLIQQNLTYADLVDAKEQELEANRPDPRGSSKPAMEYSAPTERELALLELAEEHAERAYGRGKVPPGLDLFAYAEKEGVELPVAARMEEPPDAVDAAMEDAAAGRALERVLARRAEERKAAGEKGQG